jgi:hypothetical protein
LQFVFLTGVSKFAKLSIFSALNSLDDITMDESYAAICGYTQEELEYYFSEHIDAMVAKDSDTRENLLDNIRRWYDGYTWDGKTSVYNPYSTLSFFKKQEFSNIVCELKYHSKTKTVTLLSHAIQQIHDKNYYGKYQGKGKKIILLGLAFSGKDVGCRMDALES